MKKALQIIILLFISGNAFSQSFPYMRFRKPIASNSNKTFRFTHVVSGVDAFVDIIGSKNATLDEIDDSSTNKYAWQPFITYGKASNFADTSYIDFRVTFKNNSNGVNVTQSNVAITVVDLDGSGLLSYREMVAASLPSTPKGIVGSTISTLTGLLRNTLVSGVVSYASIDTNNLAAMAQINYVNVNTFTIRVGVVGKVSSTTTRQNSFYFKGFNNLNFVLPVKLMEFDLVADDNKNTLVWKTTSEENSNRFEVYRSIDGVNFTLAGQVKASGYSQSVRSYAFNDNINEVATGKVYYKLKLIDNDETYSWSHLIYTTTKGSNTTVQSLFPNPCNGVLNVSFGTVSESAFSVEIVDAYGKTYQTVNSDDINGSSFTSFDITDLANGIYFVRINTEEGTSEMTKFVKY